MLAFFLFLVWPVLVLGQNNSSASLTTITSFATFQSIIQGPGGRTVSTGTSTILITSTLTTAPTTPSGNSTNSNSTSTSGNSTTSTSTTTPTTLPTAPATIAGGGGPNGAPSPGAQGGVNGPDDGYIAAASSLQINAMLIGFCGLVVGGLLAAL